MVHSKIRKINLQSPYKDKDAGKVPPYSIVRTAGAGNQTPQYSRLQNNQYSVLKYMVNKKLSKIRLILNQHHVSMKPCTEELF